MEIISILKMAFSQNASDIFIVSGFPVAFKKGKRITKTDANSLKPADTRDLIEQMYNMQNLDNFNKLLTNGDDDFSFSVPSLGRFRCSAYQQRNSLAAVLRVVSFDLPDSVKLGIPECVMDIYKSSKGLVLFTGPGSCGKSTTSALVIDKINKERCLNILTIEDPIEFLHKHNNSIVNQREISSDTKSYQSATKAALRQSPDVLFLAQIPDVETVSLALNAAETGQLVLTTLHTIGAANSIENFINKFPISQHSQVQVKLSTCINTIVSQQLIPSIDGSLIPVFEVIKNTPVISGLIKDGKTAQIENVILANLHQGMLSMNFSLINLVKEGRITKESALLYCTNYDMMLRKLNELR